LKSKRGLERGFKEVRRRKEKTCEKYERGSENKNEPEGKANRGLSRKQCARKKRRKNNKEITKPNQKCRRPG